MMIILRNQNKNEASVCAGRLKVQRSLKQEGPISRESPPSHKYRSNYMLMMMLTPCIHSICNDWTEPLHFFKRPLTGWSMINSYISLSSWIQCWTQHITHHQKDEAIKADLIWEQVCCHRYLSLTSIDMMYFTELQMRFPTSLVMTEKGENGTNALLAVGPVEQVVDAPE